MLHPLTVEFLYRLMASRMTEWPELRAAGIPQDVQDWAGRDVSLKADMETVWADVCRTVPPSYDVVDTVSYVLDLFGGDTEMGLSPLMGIIICMVEDIEEQEQCCEEMQAVGMALLRLLLAAGVDPNGEYNGGMYGGPLHYACGGGHQPIAELLLFYGAEVNREDVDAWTPLHWAARANRTECAQLLLSAGADPEAPDLAGCTPLFWAMDCNAFETAELLRSAGAVRTEFSEKDWEEYTAHQG